MTRMSVVAAACLLVLGCGNPGRRGGGGGHGGSGGDGGVATVDDLTVTPADAVLDVGGGTPVSLDYKVRRADGSDVTAQAALTVDDATLGSFTGATFHAAGNAGGVTHVRAYLDGHSGATSLTLKLHAVVIAPGAPPNAPGQFGGPTGGAAPALVYPPDGVLVPPNLNMLEVQFASAAGATVYEVGFAGPAIDLKIYTPCIAVGGGCGLMPDEPTWKLLSHASAATTVDVTLRASNGSTVGVAAARKLSFADEDIKGGLYYWAAASGAIHRYDFGLRGQTAEKWYTAAQSGSMCVGCHVLSRAGNRIAVGMNVPGPATLCVLDVATRATLFDSGGLMGGGSNFEALSPDGKRALVNSGADLALVDSGSGAALGGTIANATMPDWSADGATIVFARTAMMCPPGFPCMSTPGISGGELMLATVAGASFGAPSSLVAGGGNNYYPSFSPDSRWVAFNRAAADSYDAVDAKVMMVATSGGTPIDLGAVNAVAGNSWPKFAPFAQHWKGDPIFWLTFSSRRDYGLRLQQSGKTKDMQIAQVWMVAVSPKRLQSGDGGYPAFWLPFQDMTTGNHIAQWTETVARAPCTPNDTSKCMPGESCINNVCVPTPIQ